METSGKHDREIEKTGLLGIGMGDWSAPSELQNGGETPTEAADTLYFMYFLDLMRKACRWRNRDDRCYRELYDELKELFDKKYLMPDGYSVCNHESLLAFLIDLGFHGEKELNNFAKQLSARVKEKGYFHECGIIGMRHLFHSLVKIGDFEAAYRILNQTEQPSYGSWIKAGNTTLAESWNDNMSKNHHMFSDVASFLSRALRVLRIHMREAFGSLLRRTVSARWILPKRNKRRRSGSFLRSGKKSVDESGSFCIYRRTPHIVSSSRRDTVAIPNKERPIKLSFVL